MLKLVKNSTIVGLTIVLLNACQNNQSSTESVTDFVSLVMNDSLSRLDIMIDGKYFTSYMYADDVLRKPVLFPINTASEKRITRGYPFDAQPGERMDHPHHYGLWFNHGDVNGVDFWNSAVVPRKPDVRYGRINHKKFLKVESGDVGLLTVAKEWRSDTNELFLTEQTRYVFSGGKDKRLITHVTTLFAHERDVLFEDSKEGVFALRVRRELEVASDKPAVFFDENLQAADSAIVSNEGVSGHYSNSNGLEGYPEVWGKRAKWMHLAGMVDQDSISICIFDHQGNVNHPPHWMARDYGLFGVNALGSRIYTEGKETLDYVLKKGDSVTFKNQVVIINGSHPAAGVVEEMYAKFEELSDTL